MTKHQLGIFLVCLGVFGVLPVVAMLASAIYNTSFRPCEDVPYGGGHCPFRGQQIVAVGGAILCRCPRP